MSQQKHVDLTTEQLEEIEWLVDHALPPFMNSSALIAMARGKAEAEAERDDVKALIADHHETGGVTPRGGVVARNWWAVAVTERRARRKAETERDRSKRLESIVTNNIIRGWKEQCEATEAETARLREQVARLRVTGHQELAEFASTCAELLRVVYISFDMGGESARSLRAQCLETALFAIRKLAGGVNVTERARCEADEWCFVADARMTLSDQASRVAGIFAEAAPDAPAEVQQENDHGAANTGDSNAAATAIRAAIPARGEGTSAEPREDGR